MSLIFKSFPQTSIPLLTSAILGITNLTRSPKQNTKPKVFSEISFENLKLSCEILIVRIQPVLLDKMSLTIEKSHYKLNFCQFQPKGLRRQGLYFGTCLLSNLMHTETLVEEVKSVVLKTSVGISRKTTYTRKFLKTQPTMFPLRANKFKVSRFKTIQNLKLPMNAAGKLC